MNRPNKTLLRLYDIGTITSISVDYKQTGTDTADTFIVITGTNGECKGLWDTYKRYLDVQVSWRSVAVIKRHLEAMVIDWLAFEKKNAEELAEYERLKAKFE